MWASLVERFLASEGERGLEARSVQDLRMQLGFFVRHAEQAGIKPGAVTPEFLRQWCVDRVGTKSYATGKAVVWSVRKLFCWLTLTGECTRDPSAPLRYPRWRPRQSLPVYLNSEQLRAVLTASHRDDSFSDFALLSLVASTGLRSGDVACLSRFNVQVEEQLISGRVKGGWTKRSVLSDSMVAILRRHLAARTDPVEALFLTPRRQPVCAAYIRKVTKRAGERAGLSFVLTPQILRHTFGTHAADRHGRTVTKALLGHQRGATTAVYTHLSPSRFRPLMNRHPYNDEEQAL